MDPIQEDPRFKAVVKYCQYQERCHAEVKQKLYQLKVYTDLADEFIARLIKLDLLNEERFAIAYARGKFRMKGWGKIKIEHQLKYKDISPYCIRKAIKNIDNSEYYNMLYRLAEQYLGKLNDKDDRIRSNKTFRYLMQKGYESQLISEVVKDLL